MTWETVFNDDLRSWLLDEANPSVRYLTLIYLFDCAETDPKVVKARATIPGSKNVQAIFARQDSTGWWGTPERATGIKRTSGQLLTLSQMGVPPDERTHKGCDFVLSKPWVPTSKHRYLPLCYTANCLRFFTHFGFGDDARLERGWESLIGTLLQENSLKCRYQKQACHWLAVKALWAFAAASPGRDVQAVIRHTAEALLSHDFDFEDTEARWLRFGFPWYLQSDLLDALGALAACGYAADPRFRAMAHNVAAKRNPDGCWLKEAGSTAVHIERKGQPSKWITLKALRVLKAMGKEDR